MIEVKHLTKRYGDHTAVSDLSFTIEKGKIYGFLGPNGAGKSTTMNIMTGCLAASSGEVSIGGHDIYEEAEEAKRLIGYLPEIPPVYPDRTPREYLTFVARAKGVPEKELKEQVEKVMRVTQITELGDRLIKNLSKGYRQRVGIAQAILGDPEIIILDEPTVGLDPRQIIEIRTLIKKLGEDHTVILSSHILAEVQAVCETILIISGGKLIACDTPDNLEKLFASAVTVDLTAEASLSEIRELLEPLPQISAVNALSEEEGRCSVRIETKAGADDSVCRFIFFAFARAQKPILEMKTAKASLEEIFIELTEGQKAEAAAAESAELLEEAMTDEPEEKEADPE